VALSIALAHGGSYPEVLAGRQAARHIDATNGLFYSDVLFYSDRLYVIVACGLLEFENGSFSKLYRWGKHGLDGLWKDSAHQLLWVFWTESKPKLAYYYGRTWREVKFPKPVHGYFSRGDVLNGFRGVSDSRSFWIEGAGNVWRWQGARSEKWAVESLPFHLKRWIPSDTSVFAIETGATGWMEGLLDDPRLQNHPRRALVEATIPRDSFFYKSNDQWIAVTNSARVSVQDSLALRDKGIVRTTKGELFEVTRTGVSRLKAPGRCEAITASADGILLASFNGLGVFALNETWCKLLGSPYAATERDFDVSLAAQPGCIALASVPNPTSYIPGQERRHGSPGTWSYNARPGLWIAQGKDWKPVTFSPSQ
jgi:hypothetical protein